MGSGHVQRVQTLGECVWSLPQFRETMLHESNANHQPQRWWEPIAQIETASTS